MKEQLEYAIETLRAEYYRIALAVRAVPVEQWAYGFSDDRQREQQRQIVNALLALGADLQPRPGGDAGDDSGVGVAAGGDGRRGGEAVDDVKATERPESATLAAMHGMAYALLRLRNVGGDLSESQKRYQAAMRADPRPGDLVIELSTMCRYGADREADAARIGVFVREAFERHEGWERDERVLYVRRLDNGETMRWTNAGFMRLPATVDEAMTMFDPPCFCGEVPALWGGTYHTATGDHSLTRCFVSGAVSANVNAWTTGGASD
jgi:hypothetical protein